MALKREEDFFTKYLQYTAETEVPIFFHRWAATVGVGAYIGRSCYLSHGHFKIYPNIYCMLIGNPGTRKGTAIKLMKKILEAAGYDKFAAERTSKEKFLLDLSGEEGLEVAVDSSVSVLERNLWGTSMGACEVFIAIDEFNDFIGNGNTEFISMLGNMWDYEGEYKNRLKNSKSVIINNPTINILGGNTPTGFTLAFPPEILGQGFFSRLLLVYGAPSGRKITFPPAPSVEETARIISFLQAIKMLAVGEIGVSSEATTLLDTIYKGWSGIDDVRFESYGQRRFTHLLKLCLIAAVGRLSEVVEAEDVIYANTILTHTEHLMPKALGEFGKAKHSDVSHKIIQLLEKSRVVLDIKDIFKHVSSDLDKLGDLETIMRNLYMSDKVQSVAGGWLIRRRVMKDGNNDVLDFSLLTKEEREGRL